MTYFFLNLFYQNNHKVAMNIGRGQIRGALFLTLLYCSEKVTFSVSSECCLAAALKF